jgi:hypothetical protein
VKLQGTIRLLPVLYRFINELVEGNTYCRCRNEKQDITDIYVRPGVDVFDGAPHNPWSNATNEVCFFAVRGGCHMTLYG